MTPGRRIITALTSLAICVALGGCKDGPPPDEALRLPWQEISLPPAAGGERVALRAAAVCDGHWYLTGALVAADGATRPAAWTSADGRSWSAMTVAAESYYGRQNVLYTAACRDGRLAAVGAKPGGAHGNPRVSSWHQASGPGGADDVLTEVSAAFELYGGPKAVNVARLAAGPAGWLITGNRSSGAAVWLSADAAEFRIVEAAPGLASEPGLHTWASDAVAHAGGWTVVGGTIGEGRIDRDAVAWTSTDGVTWRRQTIPADGEYDEMTRVVRHGDGLVGVGLHGATFQAWRSTAEGWRSAGRFGSTQPGAGVAGSGQRAAPVAPGLATAGGLVVAAVADGVQYRLWSTADGGDRWREVTSPVALPAGANRAVTVLGVAGAAGTPDRLLLITDDGRSSRVHQADVGG